MRFVTRHHIIISSNNGVVYRDFAYAVLRNEEFLPPAFHIFRFIGLYRPTGRVNIRSHRSIPEPDAALDGTIVIRSKVCDDEYSAMYITACYTHINSLQQVT